MSDSSITHLMAGQPIRFTGRNYQGKHRKIRSGHLWLAEIEIDRPTWDLLDTMPEGASFEIVLWMSTGEQSEEVPEVPKEKPKKEPGPYSRYWQALFRWGLGSAIPLAEVLKVTELKPKAINLALRKAFEVEHLSHEVSPLMFETFCTDHGLHYLVTTSRDIASRLQAQGGHTC